MLKASRIFVHAQGIELNSEQSLIVCQIHLALWHYKLMRKSYPARNLPPFRLCTCKATRGRGGDVIPTPTPISGMKVDCQCRKQNKWSNLRTTLGETQETDASFKIPFSRPLRRRQRPAAHRGSALLCVTGTDGVRGLKNCS